ncbi:3-dehydroquinate synthase [Lactococcus garvieae subsp. garvieae]|jgi:3-dehydroquinate synthase|uniref:3-dehydroquinate synthase n=1 Tax=Lactococcus garvieae TaxID=1363 RepID=UPI0002669B3B|nr:3-dehydroquinate synthase [Lactococcus garvieae]MDN5628211.1 3-dehydroquinate synthase [Lactococcus sp.]EIT66673.1 3-dehydroquinate synthase [Lactococcus garvieae IPLA 31405]KAA8718441.1 3-dehydroquinate synthase [Lactococcus garvieae subsp. garvieae]MBS4463105.1 3-dehydroquinate synthase [Lactococcus garvieae]MCO7129434.1 3-dehydroquinate synthase [Lactococcus garvieae]
MRLNVNLPEHPYDIIIKKESLLEVGRWVAQLWQQQKVVLVTDDNVEPLYGREVASQLRSEGFEVFTFTFPAGEASKNLSTVEKLWEFCAQQGLTRSDGVIALGGGVVGDLAAFAASTYMRGIHFLQIPTSLTAQVDSSIGGKTGINSNYAKNMMGTFAQPDGVLIDPEVLKTLEKRDFREGIGEIVKCGLIADKQLWARLNEIQNADELLQEAAYFIRAACEVKRKLVVEDEFDQGTRLYLNFGHTIGHAVEAYAGYGQVMHGEAVAIGMVQISKVAERKGLMPEGLTAQIKAVLQKFQLPQTYEPWDEAALFEILSHDKKARGKMIKIVLVPEIGQAQIHEISLQEMKEYLK